MKIFTNIAVFLAGVVFCLFIHWIIECRAGQTKQQSYALHLFINREFKPVTLMYYRKNASGTVIQEVKYSWRWKTGLNDTIDLTKVTTELGVNGDYLSYYNSNVLFTKMPIDSDGMVCLSGTSNANELVTDIIVANEPRK